MARPTGIEPVTAGGPAAFFVRPQALIDSQAVGNG